MSRTSLAAAFIPLLITGTGTAMAAPAPGGADSTAQLSENLSELHAVSAWAVSLSEMADKRAKSDLVKDYAKTIKEANPNLDAKLMSVAQKQGVEIVPLDAQAEEGKSMLGRIKAEAAMLGTLEGDAFDKEYMTLVTNTQQSVLNMLKASKASTKDPQIKQYLGELTTNIQSRLKAAQEIMAKIYGNKI